MSQIFPIVHLAGGDLQDARRYLRSVGLMCCEGSRSDHAGVVVLALRLLERQPPVVDALLKRAAKSRALKS